MNSYLHIKTEILEALELGKPVVALESTLIAHGFPYPENLELAGDLEQQTREAGVVPATVAVIDGKIEVGLSRDELEFIATDKNILKASLRDMPVLLAKGLSGGTTVATTMQIADMVGIRVFVTGGIGGVHRNGETTFDISADLEALARYNVVVVSAGAKSVLDLPKTRERLETLGVPVLGYRYDGFPAFYLRDSGLPVDHRVDEPEDIVRMMDVKNQLDINGGVLLTTPVPEVYELDASEYNRILDRLVDEATREGVNGKHVTPYLLSRLKEETEGKSVETNIALIKNNLELGCRVATAFSST
ncbi:MAG: pseudouridine-5'-phosphate glycosidase [Spirochaetales bacterium]|nr:pseudouridine-5'-phosphate glycosidase [Spirochaetales bacterium]MCF7938550.1 pseudouridine-5'-phosphate glycosidase [Spirochaetales bacterium]